MISAAAMRVLVAAGVSAEVIADAMEADEREAQDRKRELARVRQQRFRNAQKRDITPDSVTRNDVTRDSVTSDHSLTSLLSSTEDSLKERKKERVRARVARGVPIPEGWKPHDGHRELAAKLRVDVGDCEERFRDYCASKGILYLDHDAAFRNFIKNQPKFNGGNGHERRRTVHDAARDLHEAAKQGRIALMFEDRLGDGPRAADVRLLPKG